ncbi:MAG: metallophosphoesterase [Deinococcota bacterium]
MHLFAIADPHLSKAQPKPMDIFGGNWQRHPDIFFERWRETVEADDVVLIPGDISWAIRLDDALLDLDDIAALPGHKILLRGNHDYWWSSIGKVRRALPDGMWALQNDAFVISVLPAGDNSLNQVHITNTVQDIPKVRDATHILIAGTRGWDCPGSGQFDEDDPHDAKVYAREQQRLELSLAHAQKLHQALPSLTSKLVVMMHYPPTHLREDVQLDPSGFMEILACHSPDVLVFGHLHGYSPAEMPADIFVELAGTRVYLVAADALGFYPKHIL